jgi:hypothetical protein
MKSSSFAVLAVAICLMGCGAATSNTSNTSSTKNDPTITGNWQLTVTSTTYLAGATGTYGIFLTQTGSAVSGIIAQQVLYPTCWFLPNPPCSFPFGDINLELAGTVDANGNIVLNAIPNTGGVAAFSVTANTATNTTFSGNYTVTEVTAYGTYVDQGTISGYKLAEISGTYQGTVTSGIKVTAALSQASVPNQVGELAVTGTVELESTPSPCFAPFASTALPATGLLLGDQLVVSFAPASNPTPSIVLSGVLSQDAKTIAVNHVQNNCNLDAGSGALTLQ